MKSFVLIRLSVLCGVRYVQLFAYSTVISS